jgi:thiol:disulfide interchange protein DsbD
MALPFLLVSFVPQVGHVLPKPGPWMNTFKQFMAFPLYITAVWLLWVLARQTDATAVAAVLMGMVLLVFAVWLRHLQPRPKGRWRYANGLLAVVATVAAFGVLTTPLLEARPPNADASTSVAKEGFWQPYSADRLAELRAQGRAVFLNLTADWCISCIANDRVALSMPSVRRVFKEKNIVPLKGDWTNYNPEITRILETFGRNGVPLYVLYPPEKDAEPQMLPQWLSPTTVIDALESI